jgi:aryl-alcohol dehydrogenase-like predicted oxidoreductase
LTGKPLRISNKIVLGTAQLGMDYGITNVYGKPSKKEVFGILEMAWQKGIRHFDTAPDYGSEEILGEFIASNGLENESILLTKIPRIRDTRDYRTFINSNLESSLEKLGCRIEVLFLHDSRDSDLLLKNPCFFRTLLNDYPVSTIGVSVYEPKEVVELSNSDFELAFQFPLNVLDRRFEHTRMPKGKRYARSVFLQGLLASANAIRPDAPEELHKLQKGYHSKLVEHSVRPVELALSYAANSDCVDYFLIGVESKQQLIYILSRESDISQDSTFLEPLLSNISNKWLDPREWK